MRATVRIWHNAWNEGLSVEVRPPATGILGAFVPVGSSVGDALRKARKVLAENGWNTLGQFDYSETQNKFSVQVEQKPRVVKKADLSEALRKLGVDVQRGERVNLSYADAEIRVYPSGTGPIKSYEIKE